MALNHIRLWTGFGSFVTVTATAATTATTAPDQQAAGAFVESSPTLWLAQGGEGGEGEMPSSYKLLSRDPKTYAFDVGPQVQNYARLVHASYSASASAAERMRAAIRTMLDRPSAETMAAARAAWVEARPAYLVTEVFRFYDGPIDVRADGHPGPEPHINSWPLNEAFIDAVKDQPRSGLVWDSSVTLTRESILQRDQVSDEADVTTGWHAIEFLLWGQDLDPAGPGNRPWVDYVAGQPDRDRRRLYLSTVTDMLVDDLRGLESAWAPDADNYRRRFLAMEPREALGRAINGVANLVGHELVAERLSVALDSGDQEDEHSCFSDTTHQDHLFDLRGAYAVWLGSNGESMAPDSLRALTMSVDPALASRTDALFTQALAAVTLMDKPFDSILRAPPGSPPRQRAEAAVAAFTALATQLAQVGRRLGVLVIVPGLEPVAG
ncbi:MAG: imelysin family protein [Panacagrimonas sp.]